MYYAKNAIVGSGHTFTYSGTALYGAIAVIAFSSSDISSPFDVENGANDAVITVLQTGNITPSENNELLISGIGVSNATTLAIDSSFSIESQEPAASGQNFGLGIAYKIQTSLGSENPQWSWSGTDIAAAVIASFKAATVSSGPSNLKTFDLLGTSFIKELAAIDISLSKTWDGIS